MYGGAEVLYPDFYSSIGMNHVAQSANQMQGMVHPLTNQRAATQSSSSLVSANRVPNLELTSGDWAKYELNEYVNEFTSLQFIM